MQELHDVRHHLGAQHCLLLRLRLGAQGGALLLLLLLLLLLMSGGGPSSCDNDAWGTGDGA